MTHHRMLCFVFAVLPLPTKLAAFIGRAAMVEYGPESRVPT